MCEREKVKMRLNNTNENLYSLNNLYTDRLLKRKMDRIKEQFFEYLEENDTTGRIDADKLINSDVSIFQYEDKFKQFLQSNAADLGYSADFILENIEAEDDNKKVKDDKKADKDKEEDFDAKSKLIEFMDSEEEPPSDDTVESDENGEIKKESIFDYAEEFNKFLSEDEDGLKINEQFAFNFDDLSKYEFDEETGKFITDENTSKEQQKMLNYISEMLLNEDIKKYTDTNEDGQISRDEVSAYLRSLNEYDEDKDNLTLKDMFAGYSEIVNPDKDTVNPDEKPANEDNLPKNETDKDTVPTNPQDNSGISGGNSSSGASGTSGTSGTSPTSSSSGLTGSSQYYNENPATKRTAPNESSNKLSDQISDIDKQIAQKNQEISSLNGEKAKIYESETEYSALISTMKETTSAIDNSVSNISSLNSQLHLANITYETKKAELDNLQDAKVLTQLQPEIDAKRKELKTALEQAETAKNNIQTKLDKENAALEKLQSKKTETQENIDKFEQEHPKSELNTINSKITALNNDIKTLETKKATMKTELEKAQKQEVDDGKVYGLATAYRESNEFVKFMMDYATNPAVRASYDNNSSLGEWCAIFTSEITEKMFRTSATGLGISLHDGSQDLGGSEMAMHAISYAKKFAQQYASAGIEGIGGVKGKSFVDNFQSMTPEQQRDAVRNGLVYPGMTFEYKNPETGAYHTGFIESINPDLTWNTIEGNSTGGKSAQHVRDASYEKLADVVDTTFTVYYLAITRGKMTAEEVNERSYNGLFKKTFT